MKSVNVPIMIVSLLLSILFWMVVYAQNMKPAMPVSFAIKLTAEGLDNERFVVTEMDELFRFTATGPDSKVKDIRNDNLAAYVDLSKAVPGTRRYPVKVFPETMEEYIVDKNMTAKVTIEPIDSKQIKVDVEGQGKLRNPLLRLTDTVSDPSEVTVKGPQSLVAKAAKARVRLDLSTVDTATSKAINTSVEILDRDDRPMEQGLIRTDPLFVRVTPVLSVAPEQKTVFISPVFKGKVASGYASAGFEVQPQQIAVEGPSLALAAISKLQTESLDIAGLRDTTTFTVRLQVPRSLAVPKGQEMVQVRVIVEPATVPQTTTDAPTDR